VTGYLLLAGRIIGLGIERPLVKKLGMGYDPFAVTTLWVGFGEIMFAVIILLQALRDPHYLAMDYGWVWLALIPGMLYGVSFHAYVHALKIGEVSLLTPLFASGFVLMYVYDVLGGWARLHWYPLCGVLLVTLGIALLNPARIEGQEASWFRAALKKADPRVLMSQPGAIAMVICAFAVATGRMVDKHLSSQADPVMYALVVNAPPVLIGIGLLAARRSLHELTRLARERMGLTWVAAIIGHGAFLLYVFSLKYFPPSVIEPVSQLGVFIAIGLGGLWFREPIRARWIPSAMVVAGAAMLLT